MLCVVCHRPGKGKVCRECLGTFRPGGERLLPGGIRVVAAFEHTGGAVRLVHHLKYRGLVGFASLVSEILSKQVEPAPLVPVPRAWSRRVKHGIDPAELIAIALSRHWDVPVLHALSRPLHNRRRAGRDHNARVMPFRRVSQVRAPVYLVDDVVTTGATVGVAARAIGNDKVKSVLAANVVPGVSSLSAT